MKIKYLISILPLFGLVSCGGQKDNKSAIEFDFTCTQDFTNSDTLSFMLVPGVDFFASKEQKIVVDWGDGKSKTLSSSDMPDGYICQPHKYEQNKTYHVKIDGSIGLFNLDSIDDEIVLSDGNINTDNFVINSMANVFILDETFYPSVLHLSVKTKDEKISKATNLTINHTFADTQYIFLTDTSLKTVTLPDTLVTLNDSFFEGLSTLETVNIAENGYLATIEDCVFDGCSSLKQFVVPPYTRNLGSCVFDGCSSLETVRFQSILPPVIKNNTFDLDNLPKKIVVPSGTKDSYKAVWGSEEIGAPQAVLDKIVEE